MYIIFFLVIFICSNPDVQEYFAKLIGKDKANAMSGFLLAFLFGLLIIFIYSLNNQNVSENFLFKVSDFNPRLNGLYNGKPTPFQFDRIGCDHNPPVGGNPDMITSNGESIQKYCQYRKDPISEYIGDKNETYYGTDPHIFPNFGDTF